jgi:transglutaminase-like putative cysteine protease
MASLPHSYANDTHRVGEEAGCTGTGDCDDFAILMSSLIESVGGTTRVVFSTNDALKTSLKAPDDYLSPA